MAYTSYSYNLKAKEVEAPKYYTTLDSTPK